MTVLGLRMDLQLASKEPGLEPKFAAPGAVSFQAEAGGDDRGRRQG